MIHTSWSIRYRPYNIIWTILYESYRMGRIHMGSFDVERFFDDANKEDLKYEKWEKIEFNINERGFE